MIGTHWFHRKWGIDELPMDDVYKRLSDLEIKVMQLEEKYSGALEDIKRLEEENISVTNELYRLENSLDARIDILVEHYRIDSDV
jgi:regulator of replication initiation timing